jgi:hypothetical protein
VRKVDHRRYEQISPYDDIMWKNNVPEGGTEGRGDNSSSGDKDSNELEGREHCVSQNNLKVPRMGLCTQNEKNQLGV